MASGYTPDHREDFEVFLDTMNPWRALLACGIMTALRSRSRRESGGVVRIRDADLAGFFRLPGKVPVSENDVKNVRRRLCQLGMLEQVSTGTKGSTKRFALLATIGRTRYERDTNAK